MLIFAQLRVSTRTQLSLPHCCCFCFPQIAKLNPLPKSRPGWRAAARGYRRAAPCLRFRGKAGRRRGLRPGGPEEWSRRRGRDPLGGGGTERPAAEGRRPGEHINPLCVRSFCYFVHVFPSNNDRISICIYVDLRKLQNEEEMD